MALPSSQFPALPGSGYPQTATPSATPVHSQVSKEDQRRARNRQAQRNHRNSVKRQLEKYNQLRQSLEDSEDDSNASKHLLNPQMRQGGFLLSPTNPSGLEIDTLIDSCSTNRNDLFSGTFLGSTEHAKGPCSPPSTAHDDKFRSLTCEVEEHLSILAFPPSETSFLLDPNLLSHKPEGELTTNSCDRRAPGRTLLHEGVILDDEEMISILLAHVADVKARDNDGRTPLHLAAALGHERAGRLLLMHGAAATLLMVDEHGMTAMHLAVQNGQTRMVKALLEFGADVNLRF